MASWWTSEQPKSQRDGQWGGWWASSGATSGGPSDRFQYKSLDDELEGLKLKRIQVPADGNCFFRAAADQLEGAKGDHAKLRQDVVAFMEAHRGDYEPFVEDDEPFDAYCRRMRRDGTWAGNMEVQALSMLKQVNVCIHQSGQPLWLIPNFPERTDFIHLTYEGGDHYNSVRRAGDDSAGPGGPLTISEVSDAMARSKAAQGGKAEEPSTSGRRSGAAAGDSRRGQGDASRSRRAEQAPAGASAKPGDSQRGKGRGEGSDHGPPVLHRASIVQLNDLDIAYEVFGPPDGPAIVFTPGWRSNKSSLRWFAHAFGRKGYRGLVWDRPNCGASSVCFEAGPSPSSRAGGSECEMQAGVLADLLEHLNMTPAVLFGTSNGGRLSLYFAASYPDLCAGVIVNNLTSGQLAAQCLSRKYYLRYADVVDMYAKDAMVYLCKEAFFEELCEANPDNRARLLATPPQLFKDRMRQWGNALLDGGNTAACPVLGIPAARIRAVKARALCLYTFRKEPDGMHTLECMEAVSRLLPGAGGRVVASSDRDVWVKAVMDFADALPKPLQGSAPPRPGGSMRGRATNGSDAAVSIANRCVPSSAAVSNALWSLQESISPKFASSASQQSLTGRGSSSSLQGKQQGGAAAQGAASAGGQDTGDGDGGGYYGNACKVM